MYVIYCYFTKHCLRVDVFISMPPHVHIYFVIPSLLVVAEVQRTSEVGTPTERSYVASMMWAMICMNVPGGVLTFRKRASYIQDGHTTPLQTPHFIYFFNKYTYWIFQTCCTLSSFFSSKCHLFLNVIFFGFCIIRILHTGCAKI
jgi:hypothetical protein